MQTIIGRLNQKKSEVQIRSMRTFSKPRFIALVLAAIMLIISPCNTFSPKPTPTLIPIASTEALVPSFTPAVSSTPAPSATPFPRPTDTSTPQPEWVTRFSQPILTVIASREPNFQDDFDDKSGGWQRENWCGEARLKYQDEKLVLTSCGARRAHIDYSDFVLELDGRFLQGTSDDAWWGIFFRDGGGAGYSFIQGNLSCLTESPAA